MDYIKRAIEDIVLHSDRTFKSILITGARQTGKTKMIKELFPEKKYVLIDDPFVEDQAISNPNMFMMLNQPPVIYDEVQRAPNLFRYIKIACDGSSENGQFCLSGSQPLELMEKASESLAGRVGIIELAPLSQREIDKDPFNAPFVPTLEYIQERNKTVSAPKNQNYPEQINEITEPPQKEENPAPAKVPQATDAREEPTTAATEPAEPDEKITATFNITVNKKDFSSGNQKFFCEIYDETGGYVVINRGILKQSGSSGTWRFSFDEQIQKVVMYSGRKYSITFIDDCGTATEPLTIESFDTAKAYTAVYTGKKAYDEVTGTTNSVYKWT